MNRLEYYKENHEKIFNAVSNPQKKIWKVFDEDGRCIQNNRNINSPKRLLALIKQANNPISLYVSISEFLNPSKNHGFFYNQKILDNKGTYHFPRHGYIISDCILLNTFYFIDLDSEQDLRIAQEDGRKIIKELGNPDFLRFSGTKGIHLGYPHNHKEIADPIERINHYKSEKKKLTTRLLKLNLKTVDKFHIGILNDIFRVYAAPHSMKANGNIVQDLDIDDFMTKDIYSLIRNGGESTPKLGTEAREDFKKSNDKKVALAGDNTSSAPHQYSVDEGAGLTSQPFFHFFVDNMVNGLKNNYVTVIKLHKDRYNPAKIIALQEEYNLSDFHISRVGDYIYACNTKLLQFERVVKILRKIKSENLSFFLTRKHLPIVLGEYHDKDGKTTSINETLGIIESEHAIEDMHSKAHTNYFKMRYKNLTGNDNKIGIMKVS